MTDRSAVQRLLRWYDARKRSLPWRDDPRPYFVLLSELMLQQTRVGTVLPYFQRFVERWPTLEALAAAPLEDVLEAWSGLGYYSRARNLHRAASSAVARGGLPGDVPSLRELPGIGPYTAGAIASIAFGQPEPAIDGNAERVGCRWFGIDADPRSRSGRALLDARIREVLPADRPGAFNQALMDLGAAVCVPRNPACAECPLAPECVARGTNRQHLLPSLAKKRAPKAVFAATARLSDPTDRVLMGRRPAQGLLAGLWEPFTVALSETPDAAHTGEAALRAALDASGISVRSLRPVGSVVHRFTHRHLTSTVFVGLATGEPRGAPQYDEVAFRHASERLPLSTLARKLLAV